MGSADMNDQHPYSAVGRKSHKWWQYLLWFPVDVSIVNAHILESEAVNHPSRSQLYFRLELADAYWRFVPINYIPFQREETLMVTGQNHR